MATKPQPPKFFPHPTTAVAPGHADARIVLEQLSELGMVFQSRSQFPLGTQMAIGLHLCSDCGSGGEFLILDGFVVGCHMDTTGAAPAYAVTLLFDGLGEADQARVRRAVGCCRNGASANPANGAAGLLPEFGPN
ncbi:hypothetical protein BH23VER1_BH23VER1_21850 [soil metagenome]